MHVTWIGSPGALSSVETFLSKLLILQTGRLRSKDVYGHPLLQIFSFLIFPTPSKCGEQKGQIGSYTDPGSNLGQIAT